MNPPIVMNVKKIRRLMKKYNLFCPIRKANPYRRMAKALKTNNVADNINPPDKLAILIQIISCIINSHLP